MAMILDLIKKRRAVFPAQYNGEAISIKDINKILEAANWAPTHKKNRTLAFQGGQGGRIEETGGIYVRKIHRHRTET